MDNVQTKIYENLLYDFDKLWAKFVILFPIANEIIKNKEIAKLKESFAEKFKNLCDSNVDVMTSSCLFERYISTYNSSDPAKDFQSEVAGIAHAIKRALVFSKGNETLTKKIKDIIKSMILTIDTDSCSKNNDYRNRLNEILVFNWLSEFENITVSYIEKDLGNGKSCDFECHHSDGSELLFEVLSKNNLKVEKQDNSQTFSDFINQSVTRKFEDKTKNLSTIPNLKIIPVLEYTEGLEDFNITVDARLAIPPLTVVKNTIKGKASILLVNLDDISAYIVKQNKISQDKHSLDCVSQ